MKNSILYLFAFLLVAGIFSCKDDAADPTFSVEARQAFTSPAGGSSIVLLKPEAANLITFSWTAARFQPSNLASPTYKLQMVLSGESFDSPVNLATTKELTYETTVAAMNNRLLGLGQLPDVPVNVDLRLVANIDDKITDVISDVITVTMTPYSDVVNIKPIYLLGSGTLAGWDNMAALEMTPLDDGKFEIVTRLTSGPDQFIKFISVLGAWVPQWGTDASGTWEGGPLVYRPDETVADPPAIPAPDFDSQFKIIADTANQTYEVFEFGEVWLLGGATTVGWDNTAALPMTKVADGKFTLTTPLNPGDFWKIIDERGAWAPQWGTDANGTAESGVLVLRPDETVADPPAIPSPATAGNYKIDVDIVNLTYTVTPE